MVIYFVKYSLKQSIGVTEIDEDSKIDTKSKKHQKDSYYSDESDDEDSSEPESSQEDEPTTPTKKHSYVENILKNFTNKTITLKNMDDEQA